MKSKSLFVCIPILIQMTTNISYKIKKVIISKIKNLNISNELEILELPIDSNKKYFIDIKKLT